jgi:hypothetical protein
VSIGLKKSLVVQLYYVFWMLLAASIAVSKFSTSVCMFTIFALWVFSGWEGRGRLFKEHRLAIVLGTGFFFLFALGLLQTENMAYGLKDLKIKLPLLFMPVILFTGPSFSKRHVLFLFAFLAGGGFISAVIGQAYFLYSEPSLSQNFRALSPFISHIRLSLILCFSMAFYYYILLNPIGELNSKHHSKHRENERRKRHKRLKWLLLVPSAFTLFYLSELQSLTALVILPSMLLVTLLFYPPWNQFSPSGKKLNKRIGQGIGFSFLAIIFFLIFKVKKVYDQEFQLKEIPQHLAQRTVNGALYEHDLENYTIENGNYVGLYYCEKELKKEWSKLSNFALDSVVKGYPLKACLSRFLTSKNLPKDSLGISALTTKEIRAVEAGVANYKFLQANGIATRLHKTFWELNNWQHHKQDLQSSVTMRFFFWSSAKSIIQNNLWTGVGIGDVGDALKDEYRKKKEVNPKKFKRTHNQYLTIAAALGAIGLLVFILLYLYPFAFYNGAYQYLYTISGVILFMSMLWEDTIETQAGVALFGVLIYVPFAQYLRSGKTRES